MNSKQLRSLGRTALKTLGGLLLGGAVTKGYITAADAAVIAGGGSGALMTILGAFLSHKANADDPAK